MKISIYRTLALLLMVTGSFAFLYSCDDGSLNPLDFNAFSLADDVALGAQLDSQVKADKNEYPILSNAAAQAYVEAIFNEILASPEIDYENSFPYQVKIVKRDDIINAFAAPGGYVYVYTGLLKYIDNEATLAAILAHEIGHCENRHATKRITKSYGVQYVLDILLGDNSDQLVQLGSEILTNLAFLKNSRDDEYEADESSFEYLKSTRWYPGASKYFFRKILSTQAEDSSLVTVLLSTHPLSSDRIAAMDKLISDAKLAEPTEANLRSTEYKNFLTNILK